MSQPQLAVHLLCYVVARSDLAPRRSQATQGQEDPRASCVRDCAQHSTTLGYAVTTRSAPSRGFKPHLQTLNGRLGWYTGGGFLCLPVVAHVLCTGPRTMPEKRHEQEDGQISVLSWRRQAAMDLACAPKLSPLVLGIISRLSHAPVYVALNSRMSGADPCFCPNISWAAALRVAASRSTSSSVSEASARIASLC